MVPKKSYLERRGKTLIQMGILRANLLITLLAIAFSLLVTLAFILIQGRQPFDYMGLVIAALVPGIIAPSFTHLFIKLLTELSRAREEMHRLAITDDLTGAHNRRYFMQRAGAEVQEALRYGRPFSIILLDVDNFKRVNDTYGHTCGDRVLQAISQACQETVRQVDVFARYGGEEFIFLMPETGGERTLQAAERVRRAVEDLFLLHDGKPFQVTASLGCVDWSPELPGLDALLNRADNALYRAKEQGKNRVCAG